MARGTDIGSGSYHLRALDALARRGRLRRLAPRTGIDFSSNDFLGLASARELASAAVEAVERGVPIGAGGSRLLRGNHPEHEALEAEAAQFFGSETALYFGGGFIANAALFSTLPARGDLVVHDSLVHASAFEGLGLTKADFTPARHNEPEAFEGAIRSWRASGGTGRPWIAVESVYSMDGDLAPLADLLAVADRHDGMLVVDEAHATGVLGEGGRGLAAAYEGRENLICLHTCGKALGVSGALVTGPAVIRDFLVNRARSFIYATAPSPLMAAVVRRSLELVASQPWRREALSARVTLAGERMRAVCGIVPTGTHIQPVIVGADAKAVALASTLQAAGYDIRAIRPPTVPEGSARVRIALTLNASDDDTVAMFETLGRVLVEGDASKNSAAGAPVSKPSDLFVLANAPPRYVVTGTGTGIGKTIFAAGLVAALDGEYWKPVQSGLDGPSDTDTVRALTGLPPERFHREAYRLVQPLAPYHSAMLEDVTIEVDRLAVPASARPLVIEGAGGLMVPLSQTFFMADLFARWGVPVVLVASTELGTINHTLLSIEAMRARDIPIAGVAFVGAENERTETFIEARGGVRRLGRLPRLPALCREALAEAFHSGFDLSEFRGAA